MGMLPFPTHHVLNNFMETSEGNIGGNKKTTPNQIRRIAKDNFQKIGRHKIPIGSIQEKIFGAIHKRIQMV
jgi:hypothetical protein